MRALRQLWLSILVMVAVSKSLAESDSAAVTPAAAQVPLSGQPDTTASKEYYVLESRHRVFAEFRQIDTVRMNQPFSIGEGAERGLVFLFNPNFSITDSGRVLQLSDTLYNPAVRVRVSVGDSVAQESWAFFYSSAPHFRRTDMFGFRLLDFRVSDRFIRIQGPHPSAVPSPADSIAKPH